MTERSSDKDARSAPIEPDSNKRAEQGEEMATPNLPFAEFVILMALLMSLVALSIDAILPGLKAIGPDLGRTEPQELQKMVTFVFAGLATGQLLYGPLSDQIGRKPTIYLGLLLFFIGSLLGWQAQNYETMLLGRFLQGFGVAGPRIVMIALIRDLYAGRVMARVMSFIMGVFIFVPTVAPIMGQAVFSLWGWRAIFLCFLILGLIGGLWMALRQNETLLPTKRVPMTFRNYWIGTRVVFSTPSCLGYMIMAGLVSGPFVGYLSTAQNLFQTTYGVGDAFPYYFAGLALSIGVASFMNSRLVMQFGMLKLIRFALLGMLAMAILALGISYGYDFVPPIWLLMLLFSPLFFCIGVLFGNMNALAIEEVGQIAGMASAWIGSLSIMMAMALATLLGQFYDGTILALAVGFLLASISSLAVMGLTEKLRSQS